MALHMIRDTVRTADSVVEHTAIDAGFRRARAQALAAFGRFLVQRLSRAIHGPFGHHAPQG